MIKANLIWINFHNTILIINIYNIACNQNYGVISFSCPKIYYYVTFYFAGSSDATDNITFCKDPGKRLKEHETITAK